MSKFWRSVQKRLFEESGVEEIFCHVRNLIMATVIIAAGYYGQKSDAEVFGVINLQYAGLGVVVIGAALVLLNLIDGLHKLTRIGTPWFLRIALVGLYLFISIRLIQLVVLFRGG